METVRTIIRRYPNLESLSWDAAAYIMKTVAECVRAGRIAAMVLAGGTTPRLLYETLAKEPFRRSLPWSRVHVFWGDERFVPPDDHSSNYRMAKEALLDTVPVPRDNIHPVPTTAETPEAAADAYEQELRAFFGDEHRSPQFDLAILGIGADGHTASLFPGDRALALHDRWAAAATAPPQVRPRERITLTPLALNGAADVLFMAGRAGKEPVLDDLLHRYGHPVTREYPAALIRPREELRWYIAEGG